MAGLSPWAALLAIERTNRRIGPDPAAPAAGEGTSPRAAPPAARASRPGKAVATVGVTRRGRPAAAEDLVAVEEPLEIRLAGETVAVIMRTPGEDHRLALGYLFAEGILEDGRGATAIYHCGRIGEEGYGNVIEVAPASHGAIDWDRVDATRRRGVVGSACGVCGRATIQDLLAGIEPLGEGRRIPVSKVVDAVEALRRHQPAFEASGGTHAAALWAEDGALIAAHEDVGRHNAVDKVVGALLIARAAGTLLAPEVLAVSGRGGFEIAHKAARARIPVVACVSAPTTLAVEIARAAGVTLCGFVRGGRLNVYAGEGRLEGLGPS